MVAPRLARARRRLRRRRAAGAAARRKRRRRARHRDLAARASTTASRKGLSVIQGDADTRPRRLSRRRASTTSILSQTLQATRQPAVVLEHLLRIGRRAIVSFPNFGHWRVRVELAAQRPHAGDREPAAMPGTTRPTSISAPSAISSTCAREVGAEMERAVALDAGGQPMRLTMPWWVWNFFGEQAVFLLKRGTPAA